MENILLIDKPKGITSFDVIRVLRKKTGAVRGSQNWRMGHAGTLDPIATGLLIVGVGNSTKKLKNLIGLDKEYIAEILLGVRTNTGDISGKVIEKKPVPNVMLSDDITLGNVIKKLVGEPELAVPAYSAVKHKGKPLYKYARKGEDIPPIRKKMKIYEAELLEIKNNILKVRFVVGSGTYIRSIAEKLGDKLGTAATLKELRRTKIGTFHVEDAQKLQSIKITP